MIGSFAAGQPAGQGRSRLTEVSRSLAIREGDLVVHMQSTASPVSKASETIDAAGAPHDCMELTLSLAATGSILPVENIELLTRYGSDDSEVRSSTSSVASPGRLAKRA